MVIVLNAPPPKRNTWGRIGAGLGQGLGEALTEGIEGKKEQKKLFDQRQYELEKMLLGEQLRSETELKKLHQKNDLRKQLLSESGLGKYFGVNESETSEENPSFQDRILNNEKPNKKESPSLERNQETELGSIKIPSRVPEEAIYQAELIGEHNLAQQFREHNKNIIEQEKLDEKRRKEERRQFEEERKYHTEGIKETEKEVENLRRNLPRQEMSLDLARDAVESHNPSFFSLDKLADLTGIDLFRTTRGTELITAAKENLLSNMSRASARAQNIWFEQRLNSMFPKIGQSQESNLTALEMLEGEVAMSKAYQELYDHVAQKDQTENGYVKKDVGKRVSKALEPFQKQIFERTSYRIRELEEKEIGQKKLKDNVGKKVSKGTPMTLKNLILFDEKFGDNAIQVAEKAGYKIPTYEEFQVYSKTPVEFREGLVNE